MNRTRIEWADYTWNPVTGCKRNCEYCYARRMSKRFGWNWKPMMHRDRLDEPRRVKKPAKIFVCSMAELWASWVPVEWQAVVLQTVAMCPQHTFQFLTKFPLGYLRWSQSFPDNCWLGVTIESNDHMMRLRALRHLQPVVRFASFEPLLAPIDPGWTGDCLDWAIIGAQTGPGSAQHAPSRAWVTQLVDWCDYWRIPIFMKDSLRPFVPDGYWRRAWPLEAKR